MYINFLLYLQFPFIYPPATVQYVSNLTTIHMIVLVCGILLPGNRTLNASWTNRVVCKTQSGLSNSKKYILHMYILCLDIIANQVYIFKNLDEHFILKIKINIALWTVLKICVFTLESSSNSIVEFHLYFWREKK